jgi:DNA-binding CsgD family transcriptional regulator
MRAFLTDVGRRRKPICVITVNGARLRIHCYLMSESGDPGSLRYALHVQRDEPKALRAANGARTLGLTARQQEICARIADGREYREIAADLGISTSTVVDHVRRIHRRLGVHNRSTLVALLEQADNAAGVP